MNRIKLALQIVITPIIALALNLIIFHQVNWGQFFSTYLIFLVLQLIMYFVFLSRRKQS